MLKGHLSGLLATLAVFTFSAFAQDTGIISGRVQDTTGAVVAGAQITVTNTATNVEDHSITNAEGVYRVPALRPGTYRVDVTAPGFKKVARENVELRVGATVLIDADLEVGSATDSVDVAAATPLLDTETSSTGTVVEGDYFVRMPFFQSQAMANLYLTPGVLIAGAGYSGGNSGFQINGEPSSRMSYFEDGIYGVGAGTSYVTQTLFNTVDEVKVLTTVLPAEYGHSAGGAVTVVKKGGTNQLHGRAGDSGNYAGMEQRYFFQEYKFSQPQPGLPNGINSLVQIPDAELDGPVYLPKIYDGRNKTFFLFGVKRYIQKEGLGETDTIPTPGELQGNFSFPEAPPGTVIYPIYDPTTTTETNGVWARSPFPGNIIPQSEFNPVAVKFLGLNPWALPNAPATWTSTGPSTNFASDVEKLSFYENYSARMDHELTSKLKVFATVTYNSKVNLQPDNSIVDPQLSTDSVRNKTEIYQTTSGIGQTYTISPTLISETRMNYYRYFQPTGSASYGINWASTLGIPNIGTNALPGGLPIAGTLPSVNVEETLNFKEDVTKVKGSHAFKMGYDLMRIRNNSHTKDNSAGTFSLTGTNGLNANGSSTPGTGGASLAAFLVGAVSSYSVTENLLSTLPRDWINSLYVQDDWRVSSRLTANLGLRWDVESNESNKYGQQSTFDPNLPDNTDIGAMGVIEHPKGSMYHQDWHHFQPRIGLAWHAVDKIVFRSGFSVNTVDHGAVAPPTTEYGSITATWTQPSGDYFPLFLMNQGPNPSQFGFPAIRSDGSIPFSGTNYSTRNATWVNPNLTDAYTMNWNFGVQYKFSNNYLLEGTYNGDRGVKGWESWNVNQLPYSYAWNLLQTNPTQFNALVGNPQIYRPWPNFGTITYQGQGANSMFDSGTIRIEKLYSRGLTMQAFYTYGKCISDTTSSIYLDRGEQRARCSYDRTHMFTASMTYSLPIGKGRALLNRGGVLNAIIGGWDMVWIYQISSGNPLTFSLGGTTPQYMPSIVATISGRPNSTGVAAHLRNDWQDIGTNRWVQGDENSMINSMNDFSIPAAYTQGNVGGYTMDAQRFIAANFSASKQWVLKERLTLQLRYDFQNPFKWYNWPSPINTTVNFTSPSLFGTVSTAYTNEPGTASNGGVPLENLALVLHF